VGAAVLQGGGGKVPVVMVHGGAVELAELTLRLTGSRSKIIFESLPADDPKQRRPDITLAKTHLGWLPQVSLDEGMRETVAYFRKELERSSRSN
jgi:UDP-glucuronate decarboxylase